MSSLSVTDVSSNRRDQIANFAELLKGSPLRIKLFGLIYKGKRQIKTVEELAIAMKKNKNVILTLASPLATQGLFEKTKSSAGSKKLTAYGKIASVAANKTQILRLAKDGKRLEQYATKSNPKATINTTITVKHIRPGKAKYCSILDLDQFKKAKSVKLTEVQKLSDRLPEEQVKVGLSKLLGELNLAKDWGGELADIISGRIEVNGKSHTAAFALKGPAKTGPLFPGKMGKNGDQIQRLFRAPVEYHFVQYEGLIDASVNEQMEQLAKAKSLTGQDIYYGVIDDIATRRLRLAYPSAFVSNPKV